MINTILHIRLSFGIVHSIIIYSTISQIKHTVTLLARVSAIKRARSSTFIVSESLFSIRSHGEYYRKVSLRVRFRGLFSTRSHGEYYCKVSLMVLVESASRVSLDSPTLCKSQPANSKSQPTNTKVSRQLPGQKGYVNKPAHIAASRAHIRRLSHWMYVSVRRLPGIGVNTGRMVVELSGGGLLHRRWGGGNLS
jgi:hypothetical protein